jgi:gamma-butyrobetaine dioxygenase/trimethyllysine dioxygenase
MTDPELLRIAGKLTALESRLVPSRVFHVTTVANTPYLTLTNSAIPFHNDGTFRQEPPRYVLLYCAQTASRGGQTLFVRGADVIDRLDPAMRTMLGRASFHIDLETFRAKRKLLQKHPRDGTPVLLFGDPAISPKLHITAAGKTPVAPVLEALRAVLNDPSVICYRHRWKLHDLLVFDNYKLLHARTRYQGRRLLKRIEMGLFADDIEYRAER